MKTRSFFLVFFLPTFVVLLFFSLFAMLGVIGLSFFHIDLKHALSASAGQAFSITSGSDGCEILDLG